MCVCVRVQVRMAGHAQALESCTRLGFPQPRGEDEGMRNVDLVTYRTLATWPRAVGCNVIPHTGRVLGSWRSWNRTAAVVSYDSSLL